jgi:hypothetical protein
MKFGSLLIDWFSTLFLFIYYFFGHNKRKGVENYGKEFLCDQKRKTPRNLHQLGGM